MDVFSTGLLVILNVQFQYLPNIWLFKDFVILSDERVKIKLEKKVNRTTLLHHYFIFLVFQYKYPSQLLYLNLVLSSLGLRSFTNEDYEKASSLGVIRPQCTEPLCHDLMPVISSPTFWTVTSILNYVLACEDLPASLKYIFRIVQNSIMKYSPRK